MYAQDQTGSPNVESHVHTEFSRSCETRDLAESCGCSTSSDNLSVSSASRHASRARAHYVTLGAWPETLQIAEGSLAVQLRITSPETIRSRLLVRRPLTKLASHFHYLQLQHHHVQLHLLSSPPRPLAGQGRPTQQNGSDVECLPAQGGAPV